VLDIHIYYKERETEKQINDERTEREREREVEQQKDRKTGKQKDRQIEKQRKYRQIDRKTEKR
jgi:hypothetical protein